MTIAARLRELRERSGRSARDLSTAAGLGVNAVSQIENNPDRSPSIDVIRAIAKSLGVSPMYLIDGETGNRSDGFSENDAEPFALPSGGGERPDLTDLRRRLPEVLAPEGRTLATYALRVRMAGFDLSAGDVLIVDLKTPARAGDLVLATVADLATGSATTLLRRFLAPYLIANDPGADLAPLVVDNYRTVILGRVAASFRAPQLAA